MLAHTLICHYDLNLVLLSLAIAALAAYTALDLAGRVTVAKGYAQLVWLTGGAITMGSGIWSMHFLGMLAVLTPVAVSYRWPIVGISMLPAVLASGLALFLVSRATIGPLQLGGGSLLMGLGISTMHYSGMMALQSPATMHYDLKIVAISVVIAVAVSLVALFLFFHLRDVQGHWAKWQKIGSALVMGMAIASMHYTGMAAVTLVPVSIEASLHGSMSPISQGLISQDRTSLAAVVGLGTLIISSLTLLTAFFDRRFAAQSAYTEALRQSEIQNRALAEIAEAQARQLQQTLEELKQTQSQLVQQEKMSGLGRMVAGIAHEINNPVNFIYGNLNYIKQYGQNLLDLIQLYQQHDSNPAPDIQAKLDEIDFDFVASDLPKTLQSMEIGATRIQQIVLSLRNFSRLDEAEMKPVDIHAGIDSTLLILQHRLKANAVTAKPEILVIKQYGNLPLIECYAGQLNQVFMNILSNAIDALREHKPPLPTIHISTEVLATSARIQITNNGPEISADVLAQMFDPFFTTKPVGKGTGLGLSISYQIVVNQHGGALTCCSNADTGTQFSIEIPIKRVFLVD